MEKMKVLVVDDEIHMVRLMEYTLLRNGYQVLTAFNGVEAVSKVNSCRPDLILLDIRMPAMDGFEVCKVLKDAPSTRDIPIIIVSIIADKDKAEIMGASSYILKPFSPQALIAEIQEVLGGGAASNTEVIVNSSGG